MEEYIIVSDGTVDLDDKTLAGLNVRIIPMIYIIDGKEHFFDPSGEVFKDKEFYEKVNSGIPVSTSQNPPELFVEFFENLVSEGYRKILYICFSSGLSGNYGSACLSTRLVMEKYPETEICVVDSLCASVGEGFLLEEACRKRDSGASFKELVSFVEEIKRDVCHWFVVGNLDQLKRGGRINAVEARLGSILNIHPILTTDGEGKLKVSEKVRGMKKALKCLADRFIAYAREDLTHRIIVAHADCRELAENLRELVLKTGRIKECVIQKIGPVIGAHTGSPMCAIVFLGRQEQ